MLEIVWDIRVGGKIAGHWLEAETLGQRNPDHNMLRKIWLNLSTNHGRAELRVSSIF